MTSSFFVSSLHVAPSPRKKVPTEFHLLMTQTEIIIPEFIQICRAVAVGFAVMGFIGYFVKLIHIPMYVLHVVPHISHAHIVLLEITFLCTCHFTSSSPLC